jgi:hypothetical protein
MRGIAEGIEVKPKVTSPPASAARAGPAPLKGTWIICVPVKPFITSPERWCRDPAPDDEKETCPGLSLAMRTISCSVRSGEFCGTTMTFVTHTRSDTPVKSRTAS